MDALLAPIDSYCERTDASFWAEPANALTNLAFVLAGVWGLAQARERRAGRFAMLLCWVAIAIGVGSGLFHTWANRLTALFDVIPIALFALGYMLFNLRGFGLGWPAALGALVAFCALAGVVTAAVPVWLQVASNGSTVYLPILLALLVFGAIQLLARHPAGPFNLAGAGIFAVSLGFRVADPAVCAEFPLGTHFMWHLFNAVLLAVLLAAATARAPGRAT